MGIWSREENAGRGKKYETRRPRHWKFEAFLFFSIHLGYSLLVAVGLHARCSGGFCVSSSDHGLGVGFVEDALNDLLLLRTENLGQTLVQLGLFLLKVWS